jgi:hypothetical protein
MSKDQEQARLLAERIARRMSQQAEARTPRAENKADVGEELAVMRESLKELQLRLAQIESHVTRNEGDEPPAERAAQGTERGGGHRQAGGAFSTSGASRSPWLSGMYVPAASHPSQERFGVEEAAISELVDFFEGEKKCELEPGGKPCDHCAMCNTRGF